MEVGARAADLKEAGRRDREGGPETSPCPQPRMRWLRRATPFCRRTDLYGEFRTYFRTYDEFRTT